MAVVALGLAACDPYVKVTGVVREPSGTPLENVTVTLTMPGREPDIDTTANDGNFNVGIVGADSEKTSIAFRKDGFQPIEELVGRQEQRTMAVTLLPK